METLNRLPWAVQSAVFKKLESITDVSAMTRAERLQYDEALKKYRDTISVFMGLGIADIRKATGLSEEEIRDL